jgi:ATP-dependent HslUV protease, peptidase subunit HslV
MPSSSLSALKIHSTTIIGVCQNGEVALAGDGQVTLGDTILKGTARKVRRMYNGTVLAGFAGSVADAQTLADKFEEKLEQSGGVLRRAAIEFARDWRTDRAMRRLEAMMLVASTEGLLLLSGDGNVIEPDSGIMAIGSGGSFARSAALALSRHTSLSAREIATESLKIAAELCVYTNDNILIETIESK